MAFEGSNEQVRAESVRGLSCEGCIHSQMKARLIGYRFCNKYKVPRNERCIDFVGKGNASKREG